MLKAIAIIGYGYVGKACHKAFEHNTEFIIIDPKYNQNNVEMLKGDSHPELTFVALPAPTLNDGRVDASIIYDIFQQLMNIEYKGIVVLKSTLTPDIVRDLYNKFSIEQQFNGFRYVYSPEFLRQAYWETDALDQEQIIVAGSYEDRSEVIELYKRHSHVLTKNYVETDYERAALLKYSINSYLATKVVFMNQLYNLFCDICSPENPSLEWHSFAYDIMTDGRIGLTHMNVPGKDMQFGYGGACFPKDMKALIAFDKEHRLSLIREAEEANTIIRLVNE